MLKKETIKTFLGFGDKKRGEYYYSLGMKRSRNGIVPGWKISQSANGVNPSGLVNWYAEKPGTGVGVYAVCDDGKIYKADVGGVSWALVNNPGAGSHGNGLIVDQKGRLLYARDQYLGKSDDGEFSGTTDTWQTFDATITSYRPMELYEDWVLIGNGNSIAVFNVNDAAPTITYPFTLPTGFTIRCIKAGKNGVLVGVNVNGRGYLMLWDVYSTRAIAPWIPLKTMVSSIAVDDDGNWIVTTGKEILITNGYSSKPFCQLPDAKVTDKYLQNIIPAGTLFHENNLLISFWHSSPLTRSKQGLMIFNTETKLWEFCPMSNNYLYDSKIGAIYLDSLMTLQIGYQTITGGQAYYFGTITNNVNPFSVLISPELGTENENWKVAEAIKLSIAFDTVNNLRYATHTWKITAKIYDFRKQLWGQGFTNGVSSALNKISNLGSNVLFKTAEVGDEVTILHGANAGKIRHITAIANPGTSSEEWTLDSNLPNLTETSIYMDLLPFKKIEQRNVRATEDYYFNIKNKYKGKKFLVKLVFEGDQMFPELSSLNLFYNDLGF